VSTHHEESAWFARLRRREPRPRRRWRRHTDTVHFGATAAALGAAAIVLVSALILLQQSETGPIAPVDVQLTVNATAPVLHLTPAFWGANVGLNVPIASTLSDAVASTPVTTIRFPGGAAGDAFNYTSGMVTNASGVASPAAVDLATFVAWCRAINCRAILELPGEIDNPFVAAAYVRYTEQTLGFRPAAWEVGNEPALWTHFGIPWAKWSIAQTSTVNATGYAHLVQSYLTAIRTVDPGAPVLGLPGVGTGAYLETQWINATVQVNGANLAGIGIHVYPAGPGDPASGSLSDFFTNVTGTRSLSARVATDRAAIAALAPPGISLPLVVDELGSASSGGSFVGYLSTFANVPFVASEIVQAMALNVSEVDVTQVQTPHLGAWLDGNGTLHPLFLLYSQLLPHLGTTIVPSELTPNATGVSVLTTLVGPEGPTVALVVNANPSTPATVRFNGSGLPMAGPVSAWSWNGSSPGPIGLDLLNVPAFAVLPPMSVLMLQVPGVPTTPPATGGSIALASPGSAWQLPVVRRD
jgi:hypothetical protein